jgi:hypothetical protein
MNDLSSAQLAAARPVSGRTHECGAAGLARERGGVGGVFVAAGVGVLGAAAVGEVAADRL